MEWNEDSVITIIGYENIVSTKTQSSSFFKDVISIKLKNEGNLNSNYVESFEIGSFKSFLIGSNTKFDRNSGKILYNVSLAKGEEKTIEYSVNYISLYIILIVIKILQL